jgi:hypothetical protein
LIYCFVFLTPMVMAWIWTICIIGSQESEM